jgi:hypothetical protein
MMTMVISGSDGVTFPDSTTQNTTDRYGFVNRIINGDMRIDQRNAGASVTINTGSGGYTLDRWGAFGVTSDGVFTVQQDSTVPSGFNTSLKVTVTTEDASIGATEQYLLQQVIEGYNTADLNWGSANAKTVTLSFWVRSSVTGTFGGSLRNSAVDRSYPFTYTISSADTYEYKTITIAGDTSGTWLITNGEGVRVSFSLGSGADRVDTAGAWVGANRTGATGQTQLIGTLNATWYITGVQLEVGSVATPFERRPFGTELALCQRYYEKSYNIGTTPGTATTVGNLSTVYNGVSTSSYIGAGVSFRVSKRAAPTIVLYDNGGTSGKLTVSTPGVSETNGQDGTAERVGENMFSFYRASGTTGVVLYGHFTASAEL